MPTKQAVEATILLRETLLVLAAMHSAACARNVLKLRDMHPVAGVSPQVTLADDQARKVRAFLGEEK